MLVCRGLHSAIVGRRVGDLADEQMDYESWPPIPRFKHG